MIRRDGPWRDRPKASAINIYHPELELMMPYLLMGVCPETEAASSPRKQFTSMLSGGLKMTVPLQPFWEEILWIIMYVDSDI